MLDALGIDPDDYAAALETGADIEVEAKDVVQGIHETGLKDQLIENAKTEPGGMTAKEAREAGANRASTIKKETAEAVDLARKTEEELESAALVQANVRSQLAALGKSEGGRRDGRSGLRSRHRRRQARGRIAV